MKKAVVNQDKCIGCGSCAMTASKSFKMDGNKAAVIDPAGDSEEVVTEALEACPAEAISWKEEA